MNDAKIDDVSAVAVLGRVAELIRAASGLCDLVACDIERNGPIRDAARNILLRLDDAMVALERGLLPFAREGGAA